MDEPNAPNLAHIHWSSPELILGNPTNTLSTADEAMDYFAHSPFWDAQSNNNQLRTQRRIEDPTYGSAKERMYVYKVFTNSSELLAFRSGFEYIVSHARAPDLFVIQQRPVLPDGGRGKATHAYFILHDKIYMSPSLYDVMSTRLRNAAWLVESTFDSLEKAHPPANPRASSVWMAAAPKESEKEDDDKDKEKEKENVQPNNFLLNALKATEVAMPSLEELAGSQRPQFDAAREQKALEAMAQAAVRPNAPRPQRSVAAPIPAIISTPGVLGATPDLAPGPLPAVAQRPQLAALGRTATQTTFAPSNFAPSLPEDDSPAQL